MDEEDARAARDSAGESRNDRSPAFSPAGETRPAVDHAREQLEAILDVLPVGVFIADADGRLLRHNAAARAIWGEAAPLVRDVEEYGRYRAWWPTTGEPVAPQDWALARALLRGETSSGEEIEIEAFDGQRKIVLNAAAPIRDENGAIAGGVAAEVDITDRKRLEHRLGQLAQTASARAAELEAIFEGMTDGVIVCDDAGRLLRMNASYRRLLGLHRVGDDAVRLPDARGQLFRPRDSDGHPLPADRRPMARILSGEVLTDAAASDLLVQTADGRSLILNATGMPLRDAWGRITGGVAIFRDVTERRRLERRTQDALGALLAMAESLVARPTSVSELEATPEGETEPDLVAQRLLDLALRVLGCARGCFLRVDDDAGETAAVAFAGMAVEEAACFRRVAARLWGDATTDAAQRSALGVGDPQIVVLTGLCPESVQAPAAVLITPLRVADRLAGLLLVDHGDGSHRYSAAELELARAVSRMGALVIDREHLLRERAQAEGRELALLETNRRMNEFLSIAAHEIRTPMTAIKANAQLMERRLRRTKDTPNPIPTDALERIGHAVARLDRLVTDMLDVARIQVGTLEIRIAACDLVPLVRDAVRDQQQLEQGREISLEALPHEPLIVLADGDRIAQVVNNYITNALKYSAPEQPVHVGLTDEWLAGRRWSRVWVRDRGPGLSSEQQGRIWERFYRATGIEPLSGSGVGLGLGLSICKTIVDMHGGEVGVESAPGEGSTFWFRLPLHEV